MCPVPECIWLRHRFVPSHWCHRMTWPNLTQCPVPYPAQCPALPCPTPGLPCLTPTFPALPCPVLVCPVLSCPALPCRAALTWPDLT